MATGENGDGRVEGRARVASQSCQMQHTKNMKTVALTVEECL